jgi:hypothetical protein
VVCQRFFVTGPRQEYFEVQTPDRPAEVNPWLERTGWEPYLAELDHKQLVRCMTKPDEEEEPVNWVIWQIMGELIRYSQHSVKDRVSVFVRLEAIRTEKHQTRHHPLQSYMAKETLAKYSRPW